MEKTKQQALYDVAVLKGVCRETVQRISRIPLIFPERNSRYEPKAGELALLLDGVAKICRRDEAKTVLLNRMEAGECLGFASLYSESTPDTEVTFSSGEKDCTY